MTDFTGLNYKNLVMNFKNVILEHKKAYYPNGLNCVDKATFLKDNANIGSIFSKIKLNFQWLCSSDKSISRKDYVNNNINAESIFFQLDFDNDAYITEREFNHIKNIDTNNNSLISQEEDKQNNELAYKEALFFARRNVDKWFTVDIDRDGHWSNVEDYMAIFRMQGDDPNREHQLDASMSNEELAEKYNMEETIDNMHGPTLSWWMDDWAKYVQEIIKEQYGVELSSADMVNIKKEMIKQLNTWLFKTGDNTTHDAPLYQSLNIDSYTRLMTDKETVSCCGGDVTPPPAANVRTGCELLFTSFEYSPYNKSEEVHNRLAWAIYPEPQRVREIKEQMNKEIEVKIESGEYTSEEIADLLKYSVWEKMTDEEYAQYHEQYMNIRNMSAADFRELLKPENEKRRKKFEENSNMTVYQIVQYIDIVESVTGQDFDSPDWKINAEQFFAISERVNDTQDDAGLLDGKTRKDVPENRQKLLRFLEEKGWLYEQFKVNPVKNDQTEEVTDTIINKNTKYSYNKELGKYTRLPISEAERNNILKEKSRELYDIYGNDANISLTANEYGDIDYKVEIKKI